MAKIKRKRRNVINTAAFSERKVYYEYREFVRRVLTALCLY
jgi:hypothetical protein